MKSSTKNKQLWIIVISVAIMLLLWEAASLAIASEHILPGPATALGTTIMLFGEKGFWAVVGSTILRGLAGFAIAAISGIILGIVGGLNPKFNAFMQPWVVVMRSVPVVAFILLALIWFKSSSVPVFIGLLTMFPMIYSNIVNGIHNVDSKLIEMARFYHVGDKRIATEVYIPAIAPYAVNGISTAVGIGWRAIIVGEVLSQPQYGIGTFMQSAQAFLQVDKVIAWTVIAVLLSFLFEKLIRFGERKLLKWK